MMTSTIARIAHAGRGEPASPSKPSSIGDFDFIRGPNGEGYPAKICPSLTTLPAVSLIKNKEPRIGALRPSRSEIVEVQTKGAQLPGCTFSTMSAWRNKTLKPMPSTGQRSHGDNGSISKCRVKFPTALAILTNRGLRAGEAEAPANFGLRSQGTGCGLVRLAPADASEKMRIKQGHYFTGSYRGRENSLRTYCQADSRLAPRSGGLPVKL